jgi:hypothetical protein
MGMLSRDKGKRGEREAAAELTRLFGCEAHRGRQYKGTDDSPDVIADIEGVHVEVKRTESLSIYKSLEQATDDAGHKLPVLLHRRNNTGGVAICWLDDLPNLVAKLYLTLAANQGKVNDDDNENCEAASLQDDSDG